jgi:8-oxo-dGTP pyrophosphatase MutT (NUDIX family)
MGAQWIASPAAVARVTDRLAQVLAAPAAGYEPFLAEDRVVGWITPERAQRLARWPELFQRSERGVECAPRLRTPEARTAALAEVAVALAAEDALTAWRDERYAVAAGPAGPPLFELERAAARYFGIHTFAAHANGLVGTDAGWRMWLARRSATKAIDPGLLDNLVGGGIAAGSDVAATIVKEAWEEAGIPEDVAQRAQGAGKVDICRDQPDGLQRETIYVHDLWLPADFVPANQDGEAVEHRLCAAEDILAVLATDDITADASLVSVDFLLRHGHVPSDDPSFGMLESLRHPPISPLHWV